VPNSIPCEAHCYHAWVCTLCTICEIHNLHCQQRPGDHHRLIENPFAENAPRISEYTAQEIATLQSRLDRQLGPEYISSRAGPGGSKVHYLAAEKVINLANEVFGFNGWSSSIQNVQIDFVGSYPFQERPLLTANKVDDDHGKITLGCSIICRVTLRDGTFHEVRRL
jgi:DNA repair and recombination protein RAD52